MTAQEFVDRYNGQMVRIIKWVGQDQFVGRIGCVRSKTIGMECIDVFFDPPLYAIGAIEDIRWFNLDEIELVEKPDNKPLPLPG
jgi:hypothetical protein